MFVPTKAGVFKQDLRASPSMFSGYLNRRLWSFKKKWKVKNEKLQHKEKWGFKISLVCRNVHCRVPGCNFFGHTYAPQKKNLKKIATKHLNWLQIMYRNMFYQTPTGCVFAYKHIFCRLLCTHSLWVYGFYNNIWGWWFIWICQATALEVNAISCCMCCDSK